MKKLFATTVATVLLATSAFGTTSYAAAVDTVVDGDSVNKTELVKVNNSFANYQKKSEVILANKFNTLSTTELSKVEDDYQKQIQALSDEEFDRFIHNVVKNNDKDVKQLQQELDSIGVELQIENKSSEFEIGTLAISPSELDLSAYSVKRGGDSFWRLYSQWAVNKLEAYEASLDVVSIEWDSNVAKYYNAVVPADGPTTNRDGSQRLDGLYLFNVEDDSDFDSYAVVYVTKLKGEELHHGTKYEHTYAEWDSSFSVTAEVDITKSPISGALSFTVNQQLNEKSWPRYEDDILYW